MMADVLPRAFEANGFPQLPLLDIGRR
jgi:hypothetical protein